MEKSNFIPILPINKFMEAIEINMQKIKLEHANVNHFTTVMHEFYKPRQ